MFKRLFGKPSTKRDFPAPAPEMPFIALGDLHGSADLLHRFLEMGPAYPLVCVGDYIDRGDDSEKVLRTLQHRPDITCLSGNHEEMLLAFLKNPEQAGPRWLRYGGLQTLASFGVAGVTESSGPEVMKKASAQLKAAMGQDLIAWMQSLPTCWQSGNIALVHAGADPKADIADQNKTTLHWGHPDFTEVQREDGIWVVHGHTIVDAPYAKDGRVAIDTGAYATGRLTAALVEPGRITFETIT